LPALSKGAFFVTIGLREFLKNKPNFVTDDSKKPENEAKKRDLFVKAFSFVTEFGFIIAIPLILFGYIGKRLDSHFGTKYIVLIGILLAITTSTIWISRRIKDILKDIKR
jgi:hypothetical protein